VLVDAGTDNSVFRHGVILSESMSHIVAQISAMHIQFDALTDVGRPMAPLESPPAIPKKTCGKPCRFVRAYGNRFLMVIR